MLKKTGEVNSKGEKLYKNMRTGDISTLEHAEFWPSQRARNRMKLDSHNNRRVTPGRVMQFIPVKNLKGKIIRQVTVFHLTMNALFRKAAVMKKRYGIS